MSGDREPVYTYDVPADELALLAKFKNVLIPLCAVPRCEKPSGHDGEHGPIRLTFERLT